MRVLVCYASAYGSTKGIATEVGERLGRAGIDADVRPVDEVETIDSYAAVVLGSAIHSGRWLPQAAAFVRRHAAGLSSRPVWLFSVSSIGDTSSFFGPKAARVLRKVAKEPKQVAAFRKAIGTRGHRRFAGAIERTHWNVVGRLFLKALGGTYGDHRDWEDIDTWADAIARELPVSHEA